MNDHEETRGVMYVAVGKKYIWSATQSARSLRKHSPGLPVHLFANWEDCGFDFSRSPHPFTSVESIDSPHYRSKVDYMVHTPFDRTLYLDTDTRVLDDITPLFELLNRFEIALAQGHDRNKIRKIWQIPIPNSFPQFNCGVILYRQSERVWKFLKEWIEAFHRAGFYSDQITFRELIWLSDLRVATLPPEYNLRQVKYLLLWGRQEARPKILHLPLYHQGPFWFVLRAKRDFMRRIGLASASHVYSPPLPPRK